MAVDPIEKKPFFHALPGADAMSFGMLGCNFHCEFCQNWMSSQTLRDPAAQARLVPTEARRIVSAALENDCPAIISTYNEPLITAEWAHEVFSYAKRDGLVTGFVSNGHATPESLRFLRPVTDLFKVDLKAFRQESYRKLGGRLDAVTDSIRNLVELGFWVEVVTLVVPGFNDSDSELQDLAGFLARVSVNIPWHVTAFHPDYKKLDSGWTEPRTLVKAKRIGEDAGLRFVYAGNIPGRVVGAEDTRCPACTTCVIQRRGFSVVKKALGPEGDCPRCGVRLPGFWRQSNHVTSGSEKKMKNKTLSQVKRS
jgi:pyruvate formate lyase activating enzyme